MVLMKILETSPIPWYYFTTRFGLLGLLALTGIGFGKEKMKDFKIASFWGLIVLLVGIIWWPFRTTGHLYPVIALFSAIGIENILDMFLTKSKSQTNDKLTRGTKKFNLVRIFLIILLIATFCISFSSLAHMATNYISSNPGINDDEARAFQWINLNTPHNATILSPRIYNIYTGIDRISDRDFYFIDQLPIEENSLAEKLKSLNSKYLIAPKGENSIPIPLLSISTMIFESGNVKIFQISL
jgi:hypothetical protein